MLAARLQRAVLAARYQLRLICAYMDGLPTDASDEGSVALQNLALQSSGRCVPQPHGVVFATAGDCRAIRRPGHEEDLK